MIIQDSYYSRQEVSNSELGWLDKYFMPRSLVVDLEAAYRFGNLLDAMITEPDSVDYFKFKVGDVSFSKEEFETAASMKKVFMADAFCKSLTKISDMQKVSVKQNWSIRYCDYIVRLDVRAKWDFYCNHIDFGADLKSTACTTLKQFTQSICHFNYDRQAAWYMDIEGKNNFMFIGVSKSAPHKIFKVPVKRDDELYKSGRAKYEELAFKYACLFGEIERAA